MAIRHLRVLVVRVDLDPWGVDRQLFVIRADPVQVGVVVREDPTHQHSVGAESGSGDEIGRREAGLFNLGEEIRGCGREPGGPPEWARSPSVAIFCQVEGVEPIGGGFFERHDLHLETPFGGIPAGDGLIEIAAVEVGILGGHGLGLAVGEGFDPLHSLEVVLDQNRAPAALMVE